MSQKEEDNRHSRSQADRRKRRLNRNLDWGKLANDIELFDQSPLLLADALETTDSILKLTPAIRQGDEQKPAEDAPTTPLENVTSIQTLRSMKADTGQNNLLTRYDAEALRDHCKEVSLQQALVRKRGEQQLYLAVGSLHWVPEENPEQVYCSPLLFYPMQLVTDENDQSESGYVHSLINESGLPEFNYQLTSELRMRFNVTLPVFKSSQTLAEFLDKIEACIENAEGIVLHHDIALGLARSPAGISAGTEADGPVMRRLPPDFDAELANQLISGQDFDGLRSTLRLLKASNERELIGDDPKAELPNTPDINEVRKFSSLLERHGLGKVRFQELPELPANILEWMENVELLTNSELVTRYLQSGTAQALPLLKLTGLVELIDRAPLHLEPFVHADLAFQGTPFLFKRAKYQARLIEEQLTQLKEHFHLDRVPSKHQLLQLLDELGGVENSTIEVVDSEYFHARRRFMELSIEKPTTLTDVHRRQLNKLVKVLRFRELFVNNSEYRLALGPAYRGLKTDWDVLESVLDYAQQLSKYLGSDAMASHILGDWRNFRESFMANLDQLQVAGRGLHSLLQIDKPYNPEISVQELLEHGKVLANNLKEWNLEYGLITNYGDKTPATLLSIFSGTSKQDKATEELVRNANRELQKYLIKNRDSGAMNRINATLTWLNDVISDDSASSKDVEDVVKATMLSAQNDQITS